ncbi:hypothetical protein [Francisella opportunistica]|nr:hypothetical protein [Francisella opportunistica]
MLKKEWQCPILKQFKPESLNEIEGKPNRYPLEGLPSTDPDGLS